MSRRLRRTAPVVPLDHWGHPLELDEPEWTDDGRFWDGERLHTLLDDDVRKHQADLLAAADVVVECLDDCTPGNPHAGGKRVLPPEARRRLATAGFVRLAADSRGEVQSWRADDGTRLVLLTGPVVRPCLD
ncbi:MAG: hypothetical protein PGN11_00215 [Quadrisphaera sp.]